MRAQSNSSPALGESFDFWGKDPQGGSKGGVKKREGLGRIQSSKLLSFNLSLFLSPLSLLSPCAYTPPVFRARMSRGEGNSGAQPTTDAGLEIRPVRQAPQPSSGGDLLSAHAKGPDSQTNGMQGYGIPFCGHCGRELDPQRIRRGEPKRFCSDACRAQAWRRRGAAQNAQNPGPTPPAGNCEHSEYRRDMNADDPSVTREVIGGPR